MSTIRRSSRGQKKQLKYVEADAESGKYNKIKTTKKQS
jgi:hypothetical protein